MNGFLIMCEVKKEETLKELSKKLKESNKYQSKGVFWLIIIIINCLISNWTDIPCSIHMASLHLYSNNHPAIPFMSLSPPLFYLPQPISSLNISNSLEPLYWLFMASLKAFQYLPLAPLSQYLSIQRLALSVAPESIALALTAMPCRSHFKTPSNGGTSGGGPDSGWERSVQHSLHCGFRRNFPRRRRIEEFGWVEGCWSLLLLWCGSFLLTYGASFCTSCFDSSFTFRL